MKKNRITSGAAALAVMIALVITLGLLTLNGGSPLQAQEVADGTIVIDDVTLSPNGISENTTVTVEFRTGDAFASGDDIDITLPEGFTLAGGFYVANSTSLNGTGVTDGNIAVTVSSRLVSLNVP